jgi:hypothetical protein
VKPLRGKRTGPPLLGRRDSTRPRRCGPRWLLGAPLGVSPAPRLVRWRGGCTFRRASGHDRFCGQPNAAGKGRRAPSGARCYSPRLRGLLEDRGSDAAPARPPGRARAPVPGWGVSTGEDCPQCSPTAPRSGPDRPPWRNFTKGRWPFGRHPVRPVLKHGPRSLTCLRVEGFYETWRRREIEGRSRTGPGGTPVHPERGRGAPPARLASARRSRSTHAGTRKMVNYACAGRSQRKLWWRSVAILTCKSIVKLGYRGERLIEPSSSWFPPKFPSG